jgi:hypothetical protein
MPAAAGHLSCFFTVLHCLSTLWPGTIIGFASHICVEVVWAITMQNMGSQYFFYSVAAVSNLALQ